jgi:hypothetical protein
MSIARKAGRTVAVLLLAQLLCGPIVNFALLQPALAAPGFLDNAAAHSQQIGIAVLLSLAMAAMTIGIAIAAWPVLRPRSHAMATWLVALAIVALSASAVENINVISMLSLSRAYANADAADRHLFGALTGIVAAPRNASHYIGLIIAGSVAFVIYAASYRFALVPRILAGFGVVAAILEIVAVAMPLFGGHIVFSMLAPLGLAHLALVSWLLAKGFAQPAAPRDGE